MQNVEWEHTPQATLDRRNRMENLLAAYPTVTDAEKQEILEFMSNAPALETALLTCNEQVSEKLKAFKAEFRNRLGFTFADYMSILLVLICIGCFIAMIKDAGL